MIIQRTKSLIKAVFPWSALSYRRLRVFWWRLDLWTPSLQDTFTDIYQENFWADPESVSGRGSTLARTEVIRQELPNVLESVGAKSLLDAPCGDFNWMRYVDLGEIEYIGADVVPELITRNRQTFERDGRSFFVLDVTSDPLPEVDVIMCRDCLMH